MKRTIINAGIVLTIVTLVYACGNNENEVKRIEAEISQQLSKVEKNKKANDDGMTQLEFLSLRLKSVDLISDKEERLKAVREIKEEIQQLLEDGNAREVEDSLSFHKIDSLELVKKDLIGK